MLPRLIGELFTQKNAQLALECLALASGVSFLGDSMTEIAKRHGLTRAAVSKRCVELAQKIRSSRSYSECHGLCDFSAKMKGEVCIAQVHA